LPDCSYIDAVAADTVLKVPHFWDVKLCHWVNVSRHFEGTLILQNVEKCSQHGMPFKKALILSNSAVRITNLAKYGSV
jgi:hypothetical protein